MAAVLLNFITKMAKEYQTAILNYIIIKLGGRQMLEENVLVSFLKKFDEHPFLVKMNNKEYLIGEGEPTFTVIIHKMIP